MPPINPLERAKENGGLLDRQYPYAHQEAIWPNTLRLRTGRYGRSAVGNSAKDNQ